MLPLIASAILGKRSQPFIVSAETLQRLKEHLPGVANKAYSTNVVLPALITKRLMELFNHPGDRKCSAVTVVNTRGQLAKIPQNYAGNSSLSIPFAAFSADSSLDEIASVIHQTLENVRQSPSAELQSLMELNLYAIQHKLPLAPFEVMGMHAKNRPLYT